MRNLIKKNPKYSKKINYNALKELFTDDGSSFQMPGGDEDKDDDGHLYTMDDKDDGEGMLIVEEEGGGGVGQAIRPATSRSASLVPGTSAVPAKPSASGTLDGVVEADDEEDAEGEEDVEDDAEKDDAYGEWDAYEQEV